MTPGRVVAARVEVPLRIDFTGGFTDVPPFAWGMTAVHVNAAVEPSLAITARTSESSGLAVHLDRPGAPPVPVKANSGVWALAATAQKLVNVDGGLQIEISVQGRLGGGLGSSGAITAGLVAAIAMLRGAACDYEEIARRAVVVERAAGATVGHQDPFGCALGGIKRLRVSGSHCAVTEIAVDDAVTRAVEEHAVIVEAPGERSSTEVVSAVVDAYRRGDPDTQAGLRELRTLADQVADAVFGHVARTALPDLLDSVLHAQLRLHPSVSDEGLVELAGELTRARLAGSKLLGGGGRGGSLLVWCRPGARADADRLIGERGYASTSVRINRAGLSMAGDQRFAS